MGYKNIGNRPVNTGFKKAMQGLYLKNRIKGISPQTLNTHFKKGDGSYSDYYQVRDHLKDMIIFRRLNLTNDAFPFKGHFDFIFAEM